MRRVWVRHQASLSLLHYAPFVAETGVARL